MKINKILLGSIVALLTFGIIVYAFETDISMLQMFVGFMLFIIPITFISSFNSTTPAFILVLFIAFFGYGMYKFEYTDTLFGLLLAIVIGGSIAYFRIHKYELFSSSEYKKEAIESKEKN